MPLDVLEVDLARNGVDSLALRRVEAQGLRFDLILNVLQRDDPLRRSYLRRRWQGHGTSVSLSRQVQESMLKRTSQSLIVLSRRDVRRDPFHGGKR